MDTVLEPRPSVVEGDRPLILENDGWVGEPSNRNFPRAYVPNAGPAQPSSLDIAAGVLIAVMTIGPLAAAAIGRMTT